MVDATVHLREINHAVAPPIKTTHTRKPDVGLHLLVVIPSDEAGAADTSYFGEYLGHGNSKTSFQLIAQGQRFHDNVLKIVAHSDNEPNTFREAASAGLTTQILHHARAVDDESGQFFDCWITDRWMSSHGTFFRSVNAILVLHVGTTGRRTVGWTPLD